MGKTYKDSGHKADHRAQRTGRGFDKKFIGGGQEVWAEDSQSIKCANRRNKLNRRKEIGF